MSKFKAFPYKLKFFIDGLDNSVAVTFYDAGHILGSAQVYLEITENGKKFTLGFSGDVGRKNLPILNDPDVMPQVDYLITESTYGGKLHDQAVEMENQLETVIKEAISINSKIIVPAFSVGRTQELVYMLSKLFNEKRLPKFPVYIDSPLSVNATEIFKIHIECYDSETSKLLAQDVDIFGTQNVHYIKDVDESKKLNNLKGPAMIISASGMCEAGRVLHHLANSIGDPNTLILIIGFMAENTLGRHLIELKDSPGSFVKIYGEMHQLNARVKVLNSFSAHADANELLDYYNCFDKKLLKRIFLVHGENEQQLIFKATLEKNGYTNIEIPVRGQEIIL